MASAKDDRSMGMAWWSAVTILTSAFLLFQVQPVISKTILPWFGGSPAVWTTCVLFFQVLLLGGYAYAHLLTRNASPLWQGRIHAVLLALAVLTLPIIPGDSWKPTDGSIPALRILLLLSAKVGAPYFLLSSTGPLVQAWFSLAYPGRSPYRLYALSNIGSLGALLTYPFLFEPAFTVNAQGWLWSFGFAVFALLAGGLGIMVYRIASEMELAEAAASTEPTSARTAVPAKVVGDVTLIDDGPPWYLEAAWIMLAALASMSFLAITNYVCQDIAVVPFMWVVPLSLYLLSFIICFDREIWYFRPLWGTLGVLLIALLCTVDQASEVEKYLGFVRKMVHLPELSFSWSNFTEEYRESIYAQSALYMAILFVTCMLCHGEIVKSKPAPRHLTRYYLMISTGGALGGIFVGLICPIVFVRPFELAMGIVASFIVAWIALLNAFKSTWLARKELLQWSSAFVVVGLIFLIAAAQIQPHELGEGKKLVTQRRNFYGTITVKDALGEDHPFRSLYHGRILHGIQYLDEEMRDEATTYYDDVAGPGVAVRDYPGRREGRPMRVAIVGLGTGTMAAHARNGDYFCFYDIDPKVVKLHTDHIFTFLDRARERGATVDITLGDARIRMERESRNAANPKNYDVLVLDAFSGDAIPAHLLTVEALEIYEKQMRHDEQGNNVGILAVHISNRYLDLGPVVAALARKFNYQQVPIHYDGSNDPVADTSSDWILLTRNPEFLGELTIQAYIVAGENERKTEEEAAKKAIAAGKKPKKTEVLWTDQYSNLLDILK
jgi:hypothetical protein